MAAHAQQMRSAGRMLARLTVHTPLDKSEAGTAGESAIIEQAKRLAEAAGHPVDLIIIDTETSVGAIVPRSETPVGLMAATLSPAAGSRARRASPRGLRRPCGSDVVGREEITPPKRGRRRREQHSFVMALWLVSEPSTEESLVAAQYSCPVQVVPDQLWSVCSP